jgi:predicted AAA+ superfamily ATPase
MEIGETLTILNEWWVSNAVSDKLAKPYRRRTFVEASRVLNEYKQILMLTGLRRVGKSTIIYQLIGDLLKKVDPKKIIYFTFDGASSDILKLMAGYQRITGIDWKHETVYLFLDEVQKLTGWSSQVKLLYDAFPNIRIAVSGSASLQLEGHAVSDLAGRYFSVDLKPLSIVEYYELRYGKKVDRYELYRSELQAELDRYMLRAFPETVGWQNDADIKRYIQENVVSKIVRTDLPDTFTAVNFRLLEGMVSLFFSKPGMILSTDSLSKEFGISKTTLENHIFYLEFSKLIRVVRNFRPNIRMESRKLKKVYPSNISLALATNNVPAPYAAETLVASSVDATNYWRMGGNEIDFVMKEPLLPIEVKSGSRVDENDLKSMRYFLKKFKAKQGIVAYAGEKETRNGGIAMIPLIDIIANGAEPGYGLGPEQ